MDVFMNIIEYLFSFLDVNSTIKKLNQFKMRRFVFISLALMAVFIAQSFRNESTSSTKKQVVEQSSMINSVSVSTTDTVVVGAAIPPEIENPELLGINKEPAHATLMVYGNQAEALKANRRPGRISATKTGEPWMGHENLNPTAFTKDKTKAVAAPVDPTGTPKYSTTTDTFSKIKPPEEKKK